MLICCINICKEGGSFVLKPSLKMHLPELIIFLSNLANYDNKIEHAKFASPIYNTIPSVITSIAYGSRRDSGFRLCWRSAMHATGLKYFPKRISTIKVILVKINGIGALVFDWGCLIPASMKGDACHAWSYATFNGHLFCCKCMSKVAKIKEKESKHVKVVEVNVINMTCAHTCPCIIKLALLLLDYLADNLCRESGLKLTQKQYYELHNEDEMKSITLSLLMLSAAMLMSRENNFEIKLKKKNALQILKEHFNVGTEKAKSNYSYSGLCPLEYVPIVNLPKISIFKTEE